MPIGLFPCFSSPPHDRSMCFHLFFRFNQFIQIMNLFISIELNLFWFLFSYFFSLRSPSDFSEDHIFVINFLTCNQIPQLIPFHSILVPNEDAFLRLAIQFSSFLLCCIHKGFTPKYLEMCNGGLLTIMCLIWSIVN